MNSSTSRKTHWEQVYQDKPVDQVSWFQREPRRSLELIEASGMSKDAPIIDVGAGASVLVDQLLLNGYTDLSVLDISKNALDISKRRLGNHATDVAWLVDDVTEFQPGRSYALWHDRAVFHFLTDPSQQSAYRSALMRALASGGQAIIGTFAVDGPLRCSGLEIAQYDAASMQAVMGADFTLLQESRESHTTPAGSTQNFAWFRLRYHG
ncbi:MAG: class I SAM-dependent methyltransferase [Gammaproteobacteria bacterium]